MNRRLRTETNKIITEQKDILGEEKMYYEDLYQSKLDPANNLDIAKELKIEGPKLEEGTIQNLTTDIKEEEIWEIIKKQPKN